MMIKKIASVLSVLLMANAMMYGQQADIPLGRWNKVEAEKPGTGIIVMVRGGERIQCSLKSLSADMLTVVTLDATERKIPKTAVEKIVTLEKRSGPLWNGALIGAAIPATFFGVTIAASGDLHRDDVGSAIALVALTAGIGAGIGVGIDALVKGQVTLYKAPNTK
jgi:hypothetical protein